MISLVLFLSATLSTVGQATVARVDGAVITSETLERRIELLGPRAARMSPSDVLQGVIEEALLAEEGRRMGLASSPRVVERLDADLRSAAVSVFLEKKVLAGAVVEEARLRQMFHATSDFVSYEMIVFETREQAAAARGRIASGSTFETEARKAVLSRLYPKPEDAPPVMRAQIEAVLAEELFRAQPGTLVGPVGLSAGFALARPIRKEIGSDAAFAARRETLEAYARKQHASQVRSHLASQLRARSGVKLDEKFLAELPPGPVTGRQLDHVLATVNRRPLRYRDIEGTLQSLGAAGGHMSGPAVRTQVAWREIDEMLLQDAAIEQGAAKDPDTLARRPEVERAALAAAAAEKIRLGAPAPSEKEIREHYERNRAAYGVPLGKARPEIVARIRSERGEAALGARIAELRARARIEIDEKELAKVGGAGR